VIIHLACKDGNRNSLESRGWKLASEGFDNILALTGDYPKPGYGGMARPSFDIDSVGLLSMYSEMNRGLRDAKGRRMKPTNFFLGAVVTNHKRHEREVMPQYLKLRARSKPGPVSSSTRPVTTPARTTSCVRWLALSGLHVPVIANVFVLSLGAARAFNAGRVPGVVVTDELVALAERYAGSPDRGRSFFLELAAKQVAIARGVGFRGAYLGGKLDLADCEEILARAEAFGKMAGRTCGRCLLRLSGRVLLLRARRDDRPVLLGGERRPCRLAYQGRAATRPPAHADQLS
jgi:methylenetetrahydrofolate reductase (NADPH)